MQQGLWQCSPIHLSLEGVISMLTALEYLTAVELWQWSAKVVVTA